MPGATQSAQRSKARKLRHIMQLEDEVQSLQGITTQQQARLGALQQENSLLSEYLSPVRLPACTQPERMPASAQNGRMRVSMRLAPTRLRVLCCVLQDDPRMSLDREGLPILAGNPKSCQPLLVFCAAGAAYGVRTS